MPQIDGDLLRRWLGRQGAPIHELLGLELECLDTDAGGRVIEASASGLAFVEEGRRTELKPNQLSPYVAASAPASLKARIESDVLIVPASVASEVSEYGFSAPDLTPSDALLLCDAIGAVRQSEEMRFDAIERAAVLLMQTSQQKAAHKLLEAALHSPFAKCAGHARIKLAKHGSDRGDLASVLSLTAPALVTDGVVKLTGRARGILLTIRAAAVAQFSQRRQDLLEAERLIQLAVGYGGPSDESEAVRRMVSGRLSRWR
jgi:hypothetical protein